MPFKKQGVFAILMVVISEMKELVSIVVPIYNVEKYLAKCVESILVQTYDNLEIILVNDGATDNSRSVAEEYETKDKRVIVLDKPNGGLSDARNFGIKHAHGDFILFIDSDDFIKPTMIETMLTRLIETNSDICVCDMEYLYDDGRVEFASGGDFDVTSEKLLTINNSACNKMYKTSMFNDIEFPLGKYYEDLATIPILMYKANKVCKVNETFYVYYQRSGSIAHSANKKIFDIYYAIDRCIQYLKVNNGKLEDINKLKSLYILHGLDITTVRIKDFDDKEIRKEYLKENMDMLKQYYPDYKNDILYKNANIKKKMIFKLMERNLMGAVLKIYDR